MIKKQNIDGVNLPRTGKNDWKGGVPLPNSKSLELDKFTRQAWLHYYNNYLREHQIITDEVWRKMRLLIEKR